MNTEIFKAAMKKSEIMIKGTDWSRATANQYSLSLRSNAPLSGIIVLSDIKINKCYKGKKHSLDFDLNKTSLTQITMFEQVTQHFDFFFIAHILPFLHFDLGNPLKKITK